MAGGHGGYRKPAHPAPVSGPSAMSQRTDGGPGQPVRSLPDAKYGENAAFTAQEQAAPMSSGQAPAMQQGLGAGVDTSGIVPMGAPSQRPDEPITAGMPTGPGAGSTMNPTPAPTLTQDQANRLRSYLPVLIQLASLDDSDPQTKAFVQNLRGELG